MICPHKSIKKIVLANILLVIQSNGLAATSINSTHLNIIWQEDESRDFQTTRKAPFIKQWKDVCESFGNSLKVNQGPYGFGAFDNFTCYVGDKKALGNVIETEWILKVKSTENNVSFEITYKGDSIATADFPQTPFLLEKLYDKGLTDIIALKLLNQLPMVAKFSLKEFRNPIKRRSLILTDATEKKEYRISPPKELTLYTLAYDEEVKSWKSKVVGKAKLFKHIPGINLKKEETITKNKKNNKKDKRKFKKGLVVWKFFPQVKNIPKQAVVYAHSSEGRHLLASPEFIERAALRTMKEVNKSTSNSLLNSVSNFLLDSTASGYVGLRFGKQFLQGNKLLESTSFLGVLAEVRGGPLKGARFYYDKVPKTTVSSDGLDLNMEWSRLTIGTSIGFDINYIIDKIDIVPKIGQWSFVSTLPIEVVDAENSLISEEFEIKNRLSFGGELGVEFIKPWATIRLWAGRDQAFTYGGKGVSGVYSNRVGVDSFFGIGSQFSILKSKFRWNLLGFAFIESVTLDSTKKSSDEEKFFIESVTFEAGYVGTGIAISW